MVPGLVATAAPALEEAAEQDQVTEPEPQTAVMSDVPAAEPDLADSEKTPAEPAPVGAALERSRRTSVQRDVPSFDEILHGTS